MKLKSILISLAVALTASTKAAMPFTALPADEPIGLQASIWRFSSSLTKDSAGRIEICYAEIGQPEMLVGSVHVRPFVSSDTKMPDLRILVARDLSAPQKRVVVIVGYGIRSGVFIADIPELTSHSLVSSGSPKANENGEVTLVGFADGPVSFDHGRSKGLQGRLFFRYVPQ